MEMSFATELLKELKASSKRWFIAFCVMVALEVSTIIGFMWYISLLIEDTSISQESDNSSENTVIGGGYSRHDDKEQLMQKIEEMQRKLDKMS